MSKASDALKKLIDESIENQKQKLDKKVDNALILYRNGSEEADGAVNEVEANIEKAKDAKEKVSDAIDRIKSIRLSFDSGRKVAESTEKASTIGSALNPAAAAIAFAQKFIIDKLKIEIKDIFMTIHIGAKKEDIAETVLLPGDPYRAKWAAETFLEKPKLINEVRGMLGYTGDWKGNRVTIHGSGMGMPSLSIYVNELIKDYN